MNPQEQPMSETKRDHSAFHQSAMASRFPAHAKPSGLPSRESLPAAELQVLESWERITVPGGDPYNGIGARAMTGRAQRK
jgi:hypothetical protein